MLGSLRGTIATVNQRALLHCPCRICTDNASRVLHDASPKTYGLSAQAGAGGGAMFINSNPAAAAPSWPILDSSRIFNCTSANGGGIYVQYSAVNITNSYFQFCAATQPGAGRGGALVGMGCVHPSTANSKLQAQLQFALELTVICIPDASCHSVLHSHVDWSMWWGTASGLQSTCSRIAADQPSPT